MSVYNEQPAFLDLAIRSTLEQTFTDFEFLITNDGSNAETTATLEGWAKQDRRITLIHNQKNIGLTRALNAMLKVARGEYSARMDSDDIMLPHRLKQQVSYLDEHDSVILCGAWATVIDEQGTAVGVRHPRLERYYLSQLIRHNAFIHSTFLMRTQPVVDVGGYSEAMRLCQDYDLVLRLAPRHNLVIIPEELLEYRENSRSLSFAKMQTSLRFALKARFTALRTYGYPTWMAIYLIKPLLSYLIPARLKQWVYLRLRPS
jgi:glycosyltransferase involved in cell wall biosynthesis